LAKDNRVPGLFVTEPAKAYANLLSVIATSKIKGQRVFETLVNLMEHPVLHFLDA